MQTQSGIHSTVSRRPLVGMILAVLLAGCGDGKVLVIVKGKVLAKGQPAAGATVLFHPTTGDPTAQTASGVAGDDGTFAVSTGLDQGVPPGNYIVTLTWPDPSVKPTPQEMMMGMIEPGPDLLKGKYADKSTSTLKAEITGSTTELPPFEVEAP